ncbi:hypothetical protein ACJJTC_015727 [Scirpophaga incertulas]
MKHEVFFIIILCFAHSMQIVHEAPPDKRSIDESHKSTTPTEKLNTADAAIATGQMNNDTIEEIVNKFGFNLIKTMMRNMENRNLVVSAVSVAGGFELHKSLTREGTSAKDVRVRGVNAYGASENVYLIIWARSHDIRTTVISHTLDITEDDKDCLYNIVNDTVASIAVALVEFYRIRIKLKENFIYECSLNGKRFEERKAQMKIMNFSSEKITKSKSVKRFMKSVCNVIFLFA